MTRVAAILLTLAIAPAAAWAQVPLPPPTPIPPQPPVAPMAPMARPAPMPKPMFDDLRVELDNMRMKMQFDLGPEIARSITLAKEAASDAVAKMNIDVAALAEGAGFEARQAFEQARDTVTINRRAGDAYNSGLEAFQKRQYDRAVEAFDQVIIARAARVDASLYWKAFSQFRLGQRDNALATIALLRKEHAQSRYLPDARVLEADVRKQAGQTIDPAQIDNDEIKLLAIQGLQRSEQVVPLLQEVLGGANSLAVKKRALYVLALNEDPRAQQLLVQYAKGTGTPDLQLEAVRYLAVRRDSQTTGATLREVYTSTTDATIKREVVNAFVTLGRSGPQVTMTGDRTATVQAARPVSPASLAAQKDLVALFQAETDVELRRHIIGTLASLGAVDQIVPLIKNEREASVRQRAVSALGGRRGPESTQALIDLYSSLPDVETREGVVGALAGQRNAEALVALARKETNLRLKTTIVRHLSGMANQSKVASDYMAEVLK